MTKRIASVNGNSGSSGWASLSAAIHRYALPMLPKPMKMLGIRRSCSPPPLTASVRIMAATHSATMGANSPAPPVGSWSVGAFRKGIRNAIAAATAATPDHQFTIVSSALRQFTVYPLGRDYSFYRFANFSLGGSHIGLAVRRWAAARRGSTPSPTIARRSVVAHPPLRDRLPPLRSPALLFHAEEVVEFFLGLARIHPAPHLAEMGGGPPARPRIRLA